MKKDGAGAEKLEPEIAKLLALRGELDVAKKAMEGKSDEKAFNRQGMYVYRLGRWTYISIIIMHHVYIRTYTAFDDLVKRKMFVVSAFEIHGGVGGLFDLGPSSCALKVNR